MAQGTIIRLSDRGYGFIDYGIWQELFFHRSDVANVLFDALHDGDRVEFDIETNPRGRGDQAVRVRRVDAHPRP